MAKSILKAKAITLRRNGESIKVIAKKLKVSSSTTSLWCKEVKLTENQVKELERRAHDPNYGKRLENTIKQRQLCKEKREKLMNEGVREVGRLTKRELFIAGIALYWAEGFKCDSLAGFCNSDPEMIKFFLLWLKSNFEYKNEDFRLRIGLNIDYLDKTKEIEMYWSKATGIPNDQFQKPYYQKIKWKKIYDHPEDYHGVLRVRVKKSIDFLRKIEGFIEGLKRQGSSAG